MIEMPGGEIPFSHVHALGCQGDDVIDAVIEQFAVVANKQKPTLGF